MSIIVNSVPLPFIGLDTDDKVVIVLSDKEAIKLPLKWDGRPLRWDGRWIKLNENFIHYSISTVCFRELPAPICISNRMFSNIKIGTFGNVGNKCIIFISDKRTIGLYLSENAESHSENTTFNVDSKSNFNEVPEVWSLTCKSMR